MYKYETIIYWSNADDSFIAEVEKNVLLTNLLRMFKTLCQHWARARRQPSMNVLDHFSSNASISMGRRPMSDSLSLKPDMRLVQ